jgi:hypothetical protein
MNFVVCCRRADIIALRDIIDPRAERKGAMIVG